MTRSPGWCSRVWSVWPTVCRWRIDRVTSRLGLQGQRLPLLEFHVPKGSGRLADLLQVLENSKAALSIRRYAVGQASLEQVGHLGAGRAPRESPGCAGSRAGGTNARRGSPPGLAKG